MRPWRWAAMDIKGQREVRGNRDGSSESQTRGDLELTADSNHRDFRTGWRAKKVSERAQ